MIRGARRGQLIAQSARWQRMIERGELVLDVAMPWEEAAPVVVTRMLDLHLPFAPIPTAKRSEASRSLCRLTLPERPECGACPECSANAQEAACASA